MMIVLLQLMTLAFLFGTVIFVLIFIHQFFFVKHEPKGLPNGSMGLPFVGETFGFFTPHKSFSIGDFLHERRSRYGKVFKSYLFGSPTIVSCDLEFNTFVLQNEGKLFQSSYPKPVRDILGKHSLILATGDLHKKFRSIEVGLINKFKCKPDFLACVDKLCSSLMESWRGNQVVLFSKEAKQFTFNLMLMNVLHMEPGEPLALQLLEDFLTFMKGFVSIPINLPWTSYAKALKARTRISSTLKQVLEDRKKREELGINGLAKEDIFNENFLKGHLSDAEKVSILQDLLLAGYETTSGLLSLLVYFLVQSPQALQYLKNEHRALRRTKKEGEPINWEDYKQMKFTIMVINETLRCGNLVKFVHRKAIKDVEFKGYYIPAGWKVLPILSAVHLDPSLHQNPSEFNPWRWADPTTSKRVIPFGGGLRLCPGWELAKLEAALFLHHLVINYRWTAKEDDHPMLYPYLEFPRGLLMTLEAETSEF
ncbi:cytochrome p450 724b1 [Nicotiana attenuata]|uniref:Cytochrome P450 724B1 n=1 Tax=Nicotiana attenuata TaxID=49451 RepID=A0A1J6JFC2_NICAT|nr:cytochrome p450 724b1 [Nicotiana attenuata]